MFLEDNIVHRHGARDTAFAAAFSVVQHHESDQIVIEIGMHTKVAAHLVIAHMALVATGTGQVDDMPQPIVFHALGETGPEMRPDAPEDGGQLILVIAADGNSPQQHEAAPMAQFIVQPGERL